MSDTKTGDSEAPKKYRDVYRVRFDGEFAQAVQALAELDGETVVVVLRRLIRAEAKARGVGWRR